MAAKRRVSRWILLCGAGVLLTAAIFVMSLFWSFDMQARDGHAIEVSDGVISVGRAAHEADPFAGASSHPYAHTLNGFGFARSGSLWVLNVPIMALSIPPALGLVVVWRFGRRRVGRCRCGYETGGVSGVCPECGTPIDGPSKTTIDGTADNTAQPPPSLPSRQ